jgi:hypothetical protein
MEATFWYVLPSLPMFLLMPAMLRGGVGFWPALVTSCVLTSAGQKLGIKEVDEGIWLVSFMHYDLGYFDLEQKTLQPLDNPFGPKPVTHVSGTTSVL